MNIKTFPLQFTEDELKRINQEAKNRGLTTKAFIHLAISNQMESKPLKSK